MTDITNAAEILVAVSQYKDISSVENWKLSPKQARQFLATALIAIVKETQDDQEIYWGNGEQIIVDRIKKYFGVSDE